MLDNDNWTVYWEDIYAKVRLHGEEQEDEIIKFNYE
jgi:hypothetical protein